MKCVNNPEEEEARWKIAAIIRGMRNPGGIAGEGRILEALETEAPGLAGKIRKRMFAFADIVTLSDRNMQKVLREISTEDLSVALKAASERVLEKIFRNMSNIIGGVVQIVSHSFVVLFFSLYTLNFHR